MYFTVRFPSVSEKLYFSENRIWEAGTRELGSTPSWIRHFRQHYLYLSSTSSCLFSQALHKTIHYFVVYNNNIYLVTMIINNLYVITISMLSTLFLWWSNSRVSLLIIRNLVVSLHFLNKIVCFMHSKRFEKFFAHCYKVIFIFNYVIDMEVCFRG